MIRLAAIAISAAFGLEGCGLAPIRPVVVNSAYATASVDGRTIQVLPIRDVQVMNKDDLEDDFKDSGSAVTRNPELLFSGLMRDGLARFADHATPEAIPYYPAEQPAFRDTLLAIPTKADPLRTTFSFPRRQALEAMGIKPDLGLQLDHIRFRRARQGNGGPMWVPDPLAPPGGAGGMHFVGGGNVESLEAEGTFLLWDYRADALVACGHFTVQAGLMFGMRKSTWEEAFGAIAREMVQGSPLQGDKIAKFNYRPQNDPLRR